jgi:serine/threonine protein kinase
MTDKGEQSPARPVGYSIQSLHPGIHHEIEGAISTLKKLQKITTSVVPIDPSALAAAAALNAEAGDQPAAAVVPVLAAGDTFGRYQISRLLGRGGMGAVYLAYDSQLQRYVALKTPSLGGNPNAIQRFYREARASAQLRSPFLCPTYDVGQVSGICFISMAFIDGRALTQVMANGLLKDSKAVAKIIEKVARGLQKAHEQGIIHRDLKPDNIMIDRDGEPVVMDFGLARSVDDEVQVTNAGGILGTPGYMSPEQVEGKNVGPRTDIYSLGVILYQILTGRLPFSGSLASVLRQIGSQEPPRPSAVAKGAVDAGLERICLKMMAKSQEERFQSMAEVVAAVYIPESAPVQVAKPSVLQRMKSWFRGFLGSNTPQESSAQESAASPIREDSATSKPSTASSKDDSSAGSQTIQFTDPDQVGVVAQPPATEGTIELGRDATPKPSTGSSEDNLVDSQTIQFTDPGQEGVPAQPHFTQGTIELGPDVPPGERRTQEDSIVPEGSGAEEGELVSHADLPQDTPSVAL